MLAYELDGAGDKEELLGAVGAEGLDVLQGANRRVDLRAFAGDELEVQAHGGEREQEVSEDDGSVAAEAAATSTGLRHRGGSRLTGTPMWSNPESSNAAMCVSRS